MNNIEQGFIKQAIELGVEEEFLNGYIKYAEDMRSEWQTYVKEAEEKSADPQFRVKLAADLLSAHGITKEAEMGDILRQLGQMLGGDEARGGAAAGIGGGGLLGLILGQLLFKNPWLGLLLGAGAGGGLGYNYGNKLEGVAHEAANALPLGQGPLNRDTANYARAGGNIDVPNEENLLQGVKADVAGDQENLSSAIANTFSYAPLTPPASGDDTAMAQARGIINTQNQAANNPPPIPVAPPSGAPSIADRMKPVQNYLQQPKPTLPGAAQSVPGASIIPPSANMPGVPMPSTAPSPQGAPATQGAPTPSMSQAVPAIKPIKPIKLDVANRSPKMFPNLLPS